MLSIGVVLAIGFAVIMFANGRDQGGAGGTSVLSAATPKILMFAQITPTVPPPLTGADALLGPPDYEAAEGFAALLTKAGVNLNGVDVSVYPVLGTDGRRMLVLNIDEAVAAATPTSQDVYQKALAALATAPQVKALNLTRVTLNLSGRDAQGAYVLTATVQMAALSQGASGAPTANLANLANQAKFEMTRIGP